MDIDSLNIPQEVKQELEDFENEVERLNKGEVGEEDFKRFRLQQGIYGQRQNDVQMVRTKIPFGRVTSEQLECLAEFADRYSNGILHVTTRQDIQFHFVKINDVPAGLNLLAEHGLTTREACGNTVRNVTACHKSGTCSDEKFDVTPYAKAVSKFLLRHPLTQNLPRKFKISLGGCKGCGLAPIHDIGMTAVVKEGKRGFKLIIGGGLGSYPVHAKLHTDFVPVADLLRTCEAIVKVFNDHGDKRNRNKARLKFVLEKHGLDKTNALIKQEFDKLASVDYPEISEDPDVTPQFAEFTSNGDHNDDPEFKNWVSRNTQAQKQDGMFNVHLKLLLGDINSKQARAVAKIAKSFAGNILVNTVSQNIMIPWVKKNAFGNIFHALKELGLHKAGTEGLKDMTSCPGSETCNLGITHSRGLIDQLTQDVENETTFSSELDGVTIKASGCPNSCGQHHIASIGFSGSAKKVNGVLAPHYEVMLGGRISEDGMVFGQNVIKIPAKNAPNAVRVLVESYKTNKKDQESFPEFYDRMGKTFFVETLTPLKNLPAIEESPKSYIDFHSEVKFSLDDRGQGECAGAVTDMITDHLSEAERALFQSEKAYTSNLWPEAVRQANRSIASAARALLVTEGMDFTDNLETLIKFESLIVETGIVSETHAKVSERFQISPDEADKTHASNSMQEAKALVLESKKAHQKMQGDNSLRIRADSGKDVEALPKGNGAVFHDITKR